MIVAALIFSFSFANPLWAQSEETAERTKDPLFEFGILGGLVQSPDYPGSDQSRIRGLAFPNFRYRGKIFRSEENEGTRARVNTNPVYRFDFSFGFNFPVDSNDNNIRKGMPDIDYVLEFGPRIKVRLIEETVNWTKLELVLPLRGVIMTDFRAWRDRGLTFTPGFQMGRKGVFCPRCLWFLRFSASFADERNNDLFYQVDPAFANTNRPFYDAKLGYNSFNIFSAYVLRIGKVQSFFGLRYSNFSGAENRNSPLIRQNSNLVAIFGLGWLFWESDARAYK